MANFMLYKANLFPKNLVAGKLIETALCCVSLSVALPMSIALFHQRSSTVVDCLEEEFRQLKDPLGKEIKEVYYNKGM